MKNIEAECRLSRYGSFPKTIFNRISCANCYKLLVYVFPGSDLAYNTTYDGYFISYESDQNLDPIQANDTKIIKKSMEPLEFEKWRSCCDEAEKCCSQVMALTPTNSFNLTIKESCNSIWDGWSCHPITRADTISTVKCPTHFTADTCNSILGNAYFQCDSTGNWFKNEYGEWADYTSCLQSILPIKQRLINVNIISQSISLFFLIIGLIIFFSYKQLRVNRILLHKHFFVSLILHSFVQIIWEAVIMRKNLNNSDQYIDSNHPGCIVINLLLQYTRSTNYFWMFSESLYLHKLLISVFKEQSNLYIYYIIGWGVPSILCSIYAICTYFLNNHSCWTRNIYLIYILNAPNILTIILNFAFLINIVRILYKKLTASHTNEPHQYRKAVRATLILVPLFGIHLILSPYVMCESAPGSQVHNLINRLVESLQGFVVALIYCFFNGEVTSLLKKTVLKCELIKMIQIKKFKPDHSQATCDYDLVDNENQIFNNNTDNNGMSKTKKNLKKNSIDLNNNNNNIKNCNNTNTNTNHNSNNLNNVNTPNETVSLLDNKNQNETAF